MTTDPEPAPRTRAGPWARLGMVLLPVALMVSFWAVVHARTLRVLDGDGEPLAGVLVLSEEGPYLFQRWTFRASLTDRRGRAGSISSSPLYWKPGYHPCDFYGLVDPNLPWPFEPQAPRGPVVLHRRTGEHAVVPEVWSESVLASFGRREFELPVPPELGVRLWYDPCIVEIRARATDGALLRSEGFYFAGPVDGPPVAEFRDRRRTAFYVLDDEGRSRWKVGISVRAGESWTRHEGRPVPTHDLYVAWAPVVGSPHEIEPATSGPDESRLPLGFLTSGIRELDDLVVQLHGGTREELLEHIEAAREVAPDAFVDAWLLAVSAASE